MRKFIFALSVSICWLNAVSQKVEWADFVYSTVNFNGGVGVVADNNNFIYTLGEIQDPVIIQGDSTSNLFGDVDMILIKYDSQGNHVWSKVFGGSGADGAFHLSIDAYNNLYASVLIQGITFMDDTTYDAPNNSQVIQFDSDGNFIRYISRPSGGIPLTSGNDHIYIAYNSTVEKLDTALTTVWTKTATPANRITFTQLGPNEEGDIFVNDNNNLVVCGYENSPGSYTFDTLALSFASGSNTDEMVIISMDTSGSALWAFSLDSTLALNDGSGEVAADLNGNIYLSFYSDGSTIYFGGDSLFNTLFTDYSAILKFNSSGIPQWGRGLYTNSISRIYDLMINPQNELLACGSMTGGGSLGSFILNYPGIQVNPYVVKLNPAGDVQWFKTDDILSAGTNNFYSMGMTNSGNYLATGFYKTGYKIGCFTAPPTSRDIITAMISEANEPVPVASFDLKFESGTAFFEDNSENADNILWDFDDGQTDAVKRNPSHFYPSPGAYNACLIATNNCGSDTACTTIIVSGIENAMPDRLANSGYHLVKITGGFPFSNANIRFIKSGQADIVPDTVHYLSSGLIQANLKLDQAPLGDWDLVITSGAFNDTLFNAITLEVPDSLDIEVQVTGPRKTLVNTFWPFLITLTNKSNRTEIGIPLVIMASPDAEIIARYSELNDSFTLAALDSIGNFGIVTDSLSNDSTMLGAFLIPQLSPGETKMFRLVVRIPNTGTKTISARVGDSYFTQQNLTDMGLRVQSSCVFLPNCVGCMLDILSFVPVAGCVSGAFNVGCAIGGNLRGTPGNGAADLVGAVGGAVLSCAGPLQALKGARAAFKAAAGLGDLGSSASGFLGGCGLAGGCHFYSEENWTWPSAASLDPNSKSGPLGLTPENYISGEEALQFFIHFENMDTATAPAREVIIKDTLDANVFDIASFRFTSFSFGDSTYVIDVQDQLFVREIDLRPAKNIILRVSGALDTLNNIVTWKFSSFDTLNYDLTLIVNDGFLPPNVTRPEGEGYVTYSIDPLPGLPHLQQLTNTAHIFFDANLPIATDVFVNTIDTISPTSQVNPNPTVYNDSTFVITWGGNDAHAGINGYDIYISVNDGAYFQLFRATKKTTAAITGILGDKYEFYSIATDLADNIEEPPVDPDNSPDAVILLNGVSGNENEMLSFTATVPFNDYLEIFYSENVRGTIFYELFDVTGKLISKDKVESGNANRFMIGTSHLNNGTYLVNLTNQNRNYVLKAVKIK